MRQVDYDKQTLKEAETELRRLIIACLYGFKDYIRQDLTNEEKENLKQGKQIILKATFKQLENYKEKYAERVKQKA